MDHINRATYYKRISRWGYTHEEAYYCPKGKPLWMYRIEQEEGRDMRDMLAEGSATAKETGYTLADFAREWDVNHHTLQHWSTKWGIEWPRGVSWVQRDKAAQLAAAINEARL